MILTMYFIDCRCINITDENINALINGVMCLLGILFKLSKFGHHRIKYTVCQLR